MTLHESINKLASKFAYDLVRALREASLDEIVAETTSHARRVRSPYAAPSIRHVGKRGRRSPAELKRFADRIVSLVLKHPQGIRAEDLKRAMGVKPGNRGAKVFTKPLSIALAAKKIRKRGVKRQTTYFAV